MNDTTPHAEPTTPEDEAFDRAFREAALRELAAPASLTPKKRSLIPASPELLERRSRYRRLVVWIVGAAGALTVLAFAIGIVT